MALPRAEVVSAIFESYINSRKKDWGIQKKADDEDEEILLPTAVTPANKIRVCNKLINQVQKAKTFNDWVNIIYLCAAAEKKETLESDNRYGLFTPILQKLHIINKDALLALFIHAALTHIISKLIDQDQFVKTKEDLLKEKADKDKAIADAETHGGSVETIKKLEAEKLVLLEKISALENSKDYPIDFFNDHILVNDPLAKSLGENSFADFENNALNGKRPLTMYKKLMVIANDSKTNSNHEPSANNNQSSNAELLQSVGTFKRQSIEHQVDEESNKQRHRYHLRHRS